MKISPINSTSTAKPNFKGHFEDCYNSASLNQKSNSSVHPHSTIENTENWHPMKTNKVYFADPLEYITDSIKDKADYVVYDNEPGFPDINEQVSKNYFAKDRMNYKNWFEDFRMYFYRMEMADRKTAGEYAQKFYNHIDTANSSEKLDYYKARIADAAYNQETAHRCEGIYDESLPLRQLKESNEDKISSLSSDVEKAKFALSESKTELINRKEMDKILTQKTKYAEDRQTAYQMILESAENDKTNADNIKLVDRQNNENEAPYRKPSKWYSNYYVEDKDFLNSKRPNAYIAMHKMLESDIADNRIEKAALEANLANISTRLFKYREAGEKNRTVIKQIEAYIKELTNGITSKKTEIMKLTSEVDRIKGELIPYFDKLKNYAASRGIKVIR